MNLQSDNAVSAVAISERLVGDRFPTFIVAEISANHNQSLEIAMETVKAAYAAGADAIKLQTYTAETITLDCARAEFQIKGGTTWDGQTLYQLYSKAFTPWDWHEPLKRCTENLGMIFFSTPFDPSAVDFLHSLGVPAFKIASFEITDVPLIRYIAGKGKPVILSTGIATLPEIEEAVATCRDAGNNQLIVCKCTSAYPTPLEKMNLRAIADIRSRFGVVTGLSDHSFGTIAPSVAVALGASLIEKHLILSRSLGGPDSSFSLEPHEFTETVKAVRDAEKALGKASYELSDDVLVSRQFARSLFAVRDIGVGETFTAENIRSIRPGTGLHPRHYDTVLGSHAARNIERGSPLDWSLILKKVKD